MKETKNPKGKYFQQTPIVTKKPADVFEMSPSQDVEEDVFFPPFVPPVIEEEKSIEDVLFPPFVPPVIEEEKPPTEKPDLAVCAWKGCTQVSARQIGGYYVCPYHHSEAVSNGGKVAV